MPWRSLNFLPMSLQNFLRYNHRCSSLALKQRAESPLNTPMMFLHLCRGPGIPRKAHQKRWEKTLRTTRTLSISVLSSRRRSLVTSLSRSGARLPVSLTENERSALPIPGYAQ